MVAHDEERRRDTSDAIAHRLAVDYAVSIPESEPVDEHVALPHRDGDGRGVRGRERHVVPSRLWDGRVRVLRRQPS